MQPQTRKASKGSLIRHFAMGFLLATLLVGIYAYAQTLTPMTLMGGIYPGAPSYTIWKEGSTYYAKNAYGAITSSGTNLSQSFHSIVGPDRDIHFAEGSFITTTTLNIPSGCLITGSGQGTYLIASGDFSVFSLVGTPTEALYQATIKDLSIVGNGKANTSCYGIKVVYGNRDTIENVFITKTYAGIFVQGAHTLTLRDVVIEGTGVNQNEYGLLTEWQSSSWMNEIIATNILVGDVASNGIRLKGGSGVVMANVLVINSYKEGFLIGDELAGQYSEYLHFVNCHADSPNYAPYGGWVFKLGSADHLRGIQMDNCWAGGYRTGIILWGCTEVMISNFQGQDFLEYGIHSLANDVTIVGGMIRDWDRNDTATFSGILLEGTSANSVMSILLFNANTGLYSLAESGAADHNIAIGVNAWNAEIIHKVGANTKINLCWNATTWIP